MRNPKQVVFLFLFYFLGLPSDLILAQPPKPKPILVCADKLPDLEQLYPADLKSRRKVYQVHAYPSNDDPTRQVTSVAFEYPSLRGREERMNKPPAYYRTLQGEEIGVWVYRISDWNNLPKSNAVNFYRQYDYRDYYSGKKVIPSFRKDISEIKSPISEVGAGLTMYITGRRDDLFMFHPTGAPWGPYDLPRLNCRRPYPTETDSKDVCNGRMRIEPDLLVLYSYWSNALPCWASIEESIRKIVQFTKVIE